MILNIHVIIRWGDNPTSPKLGDSRLFYPLIITFILLLRLSL